MDLSQSIVVEREFWTNPIKSIGVKWASDNSGLENFSSTEPTEDLRQPIVKEREFWADPAQSSTIPEDLQDVDPWEESTIDECLHDDMIDLGKFDIMEDYVSSEVEEDVAAVLHESIDTVSSTWQEGDASSEDFGCSHVEGQITDESYNEWDLVWDMEPWAWNHGL